MKLCGRVFTAVSKLVITIKIRIIKPEGPKGNRPGRQAGNEIREILSAESAELQMNAKIEFIILAALTVSYSLLSEQLKLAVKS
jgi:hypothetical protein